MKNISSLGSLDYLGAGGHTSTPNMPSLNYPLKTSLIPTKGVGSATFTRATTATLTDFESLLKTAKAGEARFEGARRVENLILNSALNGGTSPTSWIVSGTNRTSALSNLNDNHSAITFSSTGTREILNQFISCEVGRSYRLVAYCEAVSGNSSDTSMVITSSGGTGSTSAGASVLTSNMVAGKYIVSNIADCTASGTLSFRIGLGTGSTPTGTGSITLSHIQVEDVTGQANQNPSEYVSSGVLSAPYHGAGVDGVKYFTTLNGNTVPSNVVVTEAIGSAIPEATLKGVMIEVASTNVLTYSGDSTNVAWANTDVTASISGISPNGTNTMNLITENGILAIHYNYQGKTVTASTVYTYSRYYKYNGRFVRHSYVSGGSVNGCYCDVDLQNGTIVNSGALGAGTFSNANIEALPNGIYKVSLTGSIGVATAGFIVSTARDVSTNVLTEAAQFYTGNSTSGFYTWGAQLEQLPMATTYIPTTTATVTRNADVLTFPNAGNVSDTQGTVLMTVIPAFDIPNGSIAGYGSNYLIDFGSDGGSIYNSSGLLGRRDGTNVISTPAFLPIQNTTYKIGSRYGSVGQRNWLNGVAGTNGSFDGSINSTTNMTIGGYGGSSAYNWGGNIKNVKIYKKVLSDAKITLLTT